MFTGFASENTPAIQVWESGRPNTGQTVYSLMDDCAPIQYFKTGSNTTSIKLYLPTSPIEGKQIKLINSKYGLNAQTITIYSSDTSGTGTNTTICTLGTSQTLDLIYSKNFITNVGGSAGSGWVTLNQGPVGSANTHSVVLGGTDNYATATWSAVIGGNTNTSTANYTGILGGSNNATNSANTGILAGALNTTNSSYAVVIGGSSNTAGGNSSGIVAGSSNNTSANYTSILGGIANAANAEAATVIGGYYGTTRSIAGNTVTPASNSPIASAAGVTQSALLLLGVQTTDATATVLRSNTSAATTTNQVILPNNSAYYFKGSITCGVTGGGNSSMWSFEGGIKRGASVGTTVLVGTPVVNLIAQNSGASTWVVALTADTTNGGLAVTVTGQASTTIRWVCKVETTEMTY